MPIEPMTREPMPPTENAPQAEAKRATRPDSPCARLERVGEAMYGPRWQTDLARDLGVADRTVRRYVAGTVPVPDDLWPKVARVIRDRLGEMNAALDDITGEVPASGMTVEECVSRDVKAFAAERGRLEA